MACKFEMDLIIEAALKPEIKILRQSICRVVNCTNQNKRLAEAWKGTDFDKANNAKSRIKKSTILLHYIFSVEGIQLGVQKF